MSTGPRSVLAVPASSLRFVTSALGSASDVVMLDIEDGVAPSKKSDARRVIADIVGQQSEPAKPVWIRINAADTDCFSLDLDLLRQLADPRRHLNVVIPMATRTAVERTAQALPGARFLPMIETAAGIAEASVIAAHDAVDGLMFGELDFRAAMNALGAVRFEDTRWAHSSLIHSAAAAGKWTISGPFPVLEDEDGLREVAAEDARIGFAGKLCIHPKQLEAVHAAFSPSPAEIEWASALLSEIEDTARAGAFRFRGQMVDAPVVARARAIARIAQVSA